MRNLELEKGKENNRLAVMLAERIRKEGVVSEDGEILTVEALNLDVDPELIEEIGGWWVKELGERGVLREGKISIIAVESSADMLAFSLRDALKKEGIKVRNILRIRKGKPRTLRGKLVSRKVHSRTRLEPVEITTAERFIVGRKIIFVDDFLATGETLRAANSMVEEAGGSLVAACVVFDKPGQHTEALPKIPLITILRIESMTPAIDENPPKIKFIGIPEMELEKRDV